MEAEVLFWSAQAGHLRNVKRSLRRGVDPCAVDPRTGFPALHIAVLAGHVGVVKELLDAGADTNQRDVEGRTALDVARGAGRDEILAMLRARESSSPSR